MGEQDEEKVVKTHGRWEQEVCSGGVFEIKYTQFKVLFSISACFHF